MTYLQINRTYPLVAAADPAAATIQDAALFQGGGFGITGSAGVLPQLDLQLGTAFSAGGGGWRMGAKYQWFKLGAIAVSGMFGYGAYSGSGDVAFLTAGTPETLNLAMSGHMWELGAPASFRLSPAFAVYSGLTFYHTGVHGSAGTQFVDGSANDLGWNIGIRITVGKIEGDLEAAFLRVHDPFEDSMRFIPYLGTAVGITF